MTYTKSGTLVAAVGVLAFALAPHEASARPVAASQGAHVAARPIAHPFVAHKFRHRHQRFFWPGVGGDFYGGEGAPLTEVTPPPTSSDVHYSYTYDVPWDWAHRYPPNVNPSDRAYVPGCTAEPVTVPGRHGGDYVVNVTRCY
jgi:hypothetical protein